MRYNRLLSSTVKGDVIMAPNLLFYQLLLVALVLICLLIHVWWPDPPRATPQTPLKPDKPRRTALQRTQTLSRAHPQTALRGL